MLPAEGFRVKVIVTLAWNCLGVCLVTNLDALLRKEDDAFRDEGIIEGCRERERVAVVHKQKGQASLGRLMTARWMEEGTEPDAVGTTVNVLGVRVFSWVNFIHRTARNVSRYQVPGRRALQPRPRSEKSTYYNTSKCGASTKPGNLGMRGFVLRTGADWRSRPFFGTRVAPLDS